jgi:hypothetical protein
MEKDQAATAQDHSVTVGVAARAIAGLRFPDLGLNP